MYDRTEILTRGQEGTLGIHGMDAEQRAVLACLARHTGTTAENYKRDLNYFYDFCRRNHILSMLRADSTVIQLYVGWMQLRRTLATVLQERGVELGAIQQTLRHRDPRTTTMCYTLGGNAVADIARQQAAAVVGAMAS